MSIDAFASALGWAAYDPDFWMPLACMALLFVLLAGSVVFDGFDLGVGCLCAFAPAPCRTRMLALLSPWRDANAFWLPLGFGLFLAAFPHAVRPLFGDLALPLGLLALGTLLRSVSFSFYRRAPLALQAGFQAGFALGAWLVAAAHGLLLAAFILQFDTVAGGFWFTAFVMLGVIAAYGLSGATWLIMRAGQDSEAKLRRIAIHWARHALRWAVAGAVGMSTVLGLVHPAVLARWGVGLPWSAVITLWFTLLASVVTIDMLLRHRRRDRAGPLPFMFTLLMLLAVLGSLFYSVFPDFMVGELTLWDGAAPSATLRVMYPALLVLLPVLLLFNLWVYRGMFGVSRPPQPPQYPPG